MPPITVDATYEGGTLKLDHPLPLGEHERVRITVRREKTLADETAGMLGWKGPAELAEYFAMDPDLDFQDSGEGA